MLLSTTLGIAPVVAQTDKSARFEVASLKPLPPLPPPPLGEQIVSERVIRNAPVVSVGSVDPGRIHSVATLREFVATAYEVREVQIVGPPWIETDRFVLDATMPPETTRDQWLAMLRNLLADRFRLTIRHETRNLPTYVLLLAKGGTRMKESPEQASSIRNVTVGSRVTITAQSATMADLAASCLYGCFSRPQAVVYWGAAAALSQNLEGIPVEVCDRGGLPRVLGCVPLAGRFRMPALWEPTRLRTKASALAMFPMSAADFADGRYHPA